MYSRGRISVSSSPRCLISGVSTNSCVPQSDRERDLLPRYLLGREQRSIVKIVIVIYK